MLQIINTYLSHGNGKLVTCLIHILAFALVGVVTADVDVRYDSERKAFIVRNGIDEASVKGKMFDDFQMRSIKKLFLKDQASQTTHCSIESFKTLRNKSANTNFANILQIKVVNESRDKGLHTVRELESARYNHGNFVTDTNDKHKSFTKQKKMKFATIKLLNKAHRYFMNYSLPHWINFDEDITKFRAVHNTQNSNQMKNKIISPIQHQHQCHNEWQLNSLWDFVITKRNAKSSQCNAVKIKKRNIKSSIVYGSKSQDRIGSLNILARSKRFLAFPEGASFSASVCFTVGIIGNPRYDYMSFGLNWGVAYDLPNASWTINYLHGFGARPQHTAIMQRRSRRALYNEIEIFINNMGYTGRSCILRTLCDSRIYFTKTKMTMIGEMLRAIFSLPKQRVFTRELHEDSDIEVYDRAYRHARSTVCEHEYPCEFSLLELSFGKYSQQPSNYY